jgi:uncharacterized protein YqhQ
MATSSSPSSCARMMQQSEFNYVLQNFFDLLTDLMFKMCLILSQLTACQMLKLLPITLSNTTQAMISFQGFQLPTKTSKPLLLLLLLLFSISERFEISDDDHLHVKSFTSPKSLQIPQLNQQQTQSFLSSSSSLFSSTNPILSSSSLFFFNKPDSSSSSSSSSLFSSTTL